MIADAPSMDMTKAPSKAPIKPTKAPTSKAPSSKAPMTKKTAKPGSKPTKTAKATTNSGGTTARDTSVTINGDTVNLKNRTDMGQHIKAANDSNSLSVSYKGHNYSGPANSTEGSQWKSFLSYKSMNMDDDSAVNQVKAKTGNQNFWDNSKR